MRSLTRVAFALAAVVLLTGGIGWAASIAVNTFEPAVAADGFCSLIEAMENANDDAATHLDCVAGDGPDVIELALGDYVVRDVHNHVYGPSGLPAVTGILTINGRTSVIERARNGPAFRLFHVTRGARLTLYDLTIMNGEVDGWRGGGLFNVGGTVAFHDCLVLFNQAQNGGGLANQAGTMVLLQTNVEGNRATRDGGGIENRAAGGDAALVAVESAVSRNTADNDGGGLSNAASTGHTASLKLIESAVITNQAGGLGGGINQYGSDVVPLEPKLAGGAITRVRWGGAQMELRVVGGRIADNVAGKHGGGVASWVWPPGFWASQVEISGGAHVSGNKALEGDAGGLFAWFEGASLEVVESTIDLNSAVNGRGGGIAVGEGAVLDLIRSTVSGNDADGIVVPTGSGGGIQIVASDAAIAESTISGNGALRGGGIDVAAVASNDRKVLGDGTKVATGTKGSGFGASVAITDSTIVDNEAAILGGGIAVVTGGGIGSAEVRMAGSILGYNLDRRGSGNCSMAYPAIFDSGGHNMADDSTCWLTSAPDGGGPVTATDTVVADLMLEELADNGGPSQTHMPLDGSPVIDVGSEGGLRTSIDQRGYPRVAGGGGPGGCVCDAGSVEKGSVLPPEPSVMEPVDG